MASCGAPLVVDHAEGDDAKPSVSVEQRANVLDKIGRRIPSIVIEEADHIAGRLLHASVSPGRDADVFRDLEGLHRVRQGWHRAAVADHEYLYPRTVLTEHAANCAVDLEGAVTQRQDHAGHRQCQTNLRDVRMLIR